MRWLLVFALLFILVTPAQADTASGIAAYDRGDYATALQELKPAAEKGDAAAQARYGLMLAKGDGVPKNVAEAVAWFRKSAAQGDPVGQYNLGIAYDIGDTGASDLEQAEYWYRKSAEQDHVRAQYNLGRMLLDGDTSAKHAAGAVWILKAAEQDHANAMLVYGNSCATGDGVEQNLLCARYWLSRAVDKGATNAQNNHRIIEQEIAEIEAGGAPKTKGGDGSTKERAILLPDAKNEIEGVRAEHLVVQTYFTGWTWQSQALINTPDFHIYDRIELSGPGGATKTIYFDIHNWFGKLE